MTGRGRSSLFSPARRASQPVRGAAHGAPVSSTTRRSMPPVPTPVHGGGPAPPTTVVSNGFGRSIEHVRNHLLSGVPERFRRPVPRAKLRVRLPQAAWIGDLSTDYPDVESRVLSVLPTGETGVWLVGLSGPTLREVARRTSDRETVVSPDLLGESDDRAALVVLGHGVVGAAGTAGRDVRRGTRRRVARRSRVRLDTLVRTT